MGHRLRLLESIQMLLEDLDTPVSLSCFLLIRNGEWKQLVEKRVNPLLYDCADTFNRDYLACSVLSKYPHLDTGISREDVAMEKFKAAEDKCLETYFKLRRGYHQESIPGDVREVFHLARRKISSLLGPFSWDSCARYFGFGPGASVGIPRRKADLWYKIGEKTPTVTAACSILAACEISRTPGWANHLGIATPEEAINTLKIVDGNTVTTVPKNAKTDRTIAIEPLMNMYFQRGIGGVMRDRLGRRGINLNDQTRNQELARYGSETGAVATLDLSGASDSISLSLLDELFEPDWVAAMKLVRSPQGVLPSGDKILYRKVSSMGNGYTFELESVIFWSFAAACCDLTRVGQDDVSVYGDDIIVPTEAADLLVRSLTLAGFEVNLEKSYISGPFRESCGKHFFRGSDVTPFYVDDDVDDVTRVFWLLNSIRRWAFRSAGGVWGCDARVKRTYCNTRKWLSPKLRRPTVPFFLNGETFSDGGLAGDFDEAIPRKARDGHEGYQAYTFVDLPRSRTVTEVPAADSWRALGKWFLRKEGAKPGPRRHRAYVERLQSLHSSVASVVQLVTGRTDRRRISVVVPRWEGTGRWLD